MVQTADLLDDTSWEDVSDGSQKDFLRLGEEMVRTTLSLGHAADLRATTMMGIFGAVGVALLSAVFALIAGSRAPLPIIVAGPITAVGLFLAAGFCAASAWPRFFFVGGFEPRNLLDSSAKNDQFRTRVLIAVVQDRIDFNRRAIDRAARLLIAAITIAGISLFAGVASFIVLLVVTGHHLFGMDCLLVFEAAHEPVLAAEKAVEALASVVPVRLA